jgi:hypothetical protein
VVVVFPFGGRVGLAFDVSLDDAANKAGRAVARALWRGCWVRSGVRTGRGAGARPGSGRRSGGKYTARTSRPRICRSFVDLARYLGVAGLGVEVVVRVAVTARADRFGVSGRAAPDTAGEEAGREECRAGGQTDGGRTRSVPPFWHIRLCVWRPGASHPPSRTRGRFGEHRWGDLQLRMQRRLGRVRKSSPWWRVRGVRPVPGLAVLRPCLAPVSSRWIAGQRPAPPPGADKGLQARWRRAGEQACAGFGSARWLRQEPSRMASAGEAVGSHCRDPRRCPQGGCRRSRAGGSLGLWA